LNNTDKSQFKEMLDTLFELYGKRHAEQNLLRVWWQKLGGYPVEVVSQSFDKWTSNSNKAPTPYDIILICRSRSQELLSANQPKLESKPMTGEKRQEVKRKIHDLMAKMTWRKV